MGNKAKAGCPIKNVQSTLDSLTEAGLSIAVFEEINDNDASRGPSAKHQLKKRALTQIVTPGARTYIYDLCLSSDDVQFRDNKPVIGLSRTALGYSVYEVYLDERVTIVSSRMTSEAARALIDTTGAAGSLYTLVSSDTENNMRIRK